MLKIEVIAKGDAFEMGVAQGEHVGEKIRSAPNVLAQLYGFRALQPACRKSESAPNKAITPRLRVKLRRHPEA